MPEIFEVTVKSGEDIRQVISDYVIEKGWQSVMIPAAIGSVIGMEFTTPIQNELPLKPPSLPATTRRSCSPSPAKSCAVNVSIRLCWPFTRIKPAPCSSISMPAAPRRAGM